MGFKQFPRFFYSESKNENSIGPVIFHMNYPRAVFQLRFIDDDPSKFCVRLISWIDMPPEDKIVKTTNELIEWADNFLKKQTKTGNKNNK